MVKDISIDLWLSLHVYTWGVQPRLTHCCGATYLMVAQLTFELKLQWTRYIMAISLV